MNPIFIFENSTDLMQEELASLQVFHSLITSPQDRQGEIFDFLKKNDIEGQNLSQSLKNWFLHIKENYKEDFDRNPALVFILYKTIQFFTYDDFKSIFPAKKAVTEQNIYDYSTEIFKTKTIDDAVKNFGKNFLASAFSSKNIEKNRPKNYIGDLWLLHKLFFFLFWDLASEDDEDVFCQALKGDWYSATKLSELLNQLTKKCNFNTTKEIQLVEFTSFKGIHFEQNESLLRLLYNFTRPESSIKEGIISELNFVREQQKAILQIWPNTHRDNFSEAEADYEIKKVRKNLKNLKNIDFGFSIFNFSQSFLINDENRSESFIRPISCKCFQETELMWKPLEYKRGRINARGFLRNMIKKSLDTKFLYPERNKITHVGENYAVFQIFTKEYRDRKKYDWKKMVLHSFFDARQYLLSCENQNLSHSLLNILDYFFEKLCQPLHLQYKTTLELWVQVFDQKGIIKLKYDKVCLTNITDTLTESEFKYLKKFMGFLYCSENLTQDFIFHNRKEIQLYLIYLSLELSKMDK